MRLQEPSHHDRTRRARRRELDGLADRRGDVGSLDFLEAESGKETLGGRRQEVHGTHTPGLGAGDGGFRQLPPEPGPALGSVDGHGTQEGAILIDLERRTADNLIASASDERFGKMVDQSRRRQGGAAEQRTGSPVRRPV